MRPNARRVVDETAAFENDGRLIREELDEIEVILAEHRLVIGVRLERSESLCRRRNRRDQQGSHAMRTVRGRKCWVGTRRICVVAGALRLEGAAGWPRGGETPVAPAPATLCEGSPAERIQ